MTGSVQELGLLSVRHCQLCLKFRWLHSSSWGRGCPLPKKCWFRRSIWCVGVRGSSKINVLPGPLSGRKLIREELWREFFSDPSQWWDHRSEKVNPRYPDFKHKKTRQSLWVIDKLTPPWVEAELATMAPDTLQSNIFAWNVKLQRYVTAGDHKKTVELCQQLQREGMIPNKFTLVPVINACSGLQSLEEGRRVHEQITEREYECDVYVLNCLVDMYAKCGSIEDAWNVFEKMRDRDVVSWNAMIGGFVKSGQGLKAIELFQNMQQVGVEPDAITFVGALNACASVPAFEKGRLVHEQINERGCESDVYVATSLVDMYAKCGSLEDALSVFNKMRERNVVSWSAIIGGYVTSGQAPKAMELFRQMQQEGVEPDAVTFGGVLNACASVAALKEGRHIHEQIIERGYECDIYVANCLVDMYTKCGSIKDAWIVFNRMQEHDVVSWSAMIGGFAKSGQGLKAMVLFQQMQQEGVEPNSITFMGVLNACASATALERGRCVHEQIIEKGWESDVYVANCLVDMYSKCGSIGDAWSVFNKMRKHTVASWTAMIGAYAMHGLAKKAIGFFKRMGKEGVEINEITFTCLLSACSHGKLVREGLRYFNSVMSCYNVLPTLEHYACMVDLLGRCGQLEEAEEVMKRLPMEGDAAVWMSLLGACRIYGDTEMAVRAAKWCCALDPENASGHVLLSNIYAAAEKKDRSAAVVKESSEGEAGKSQD